MPRTEKWKDGWLWIQTTPEGKWIAATQIELIAALIERVARLEEQMERKS